MHSQNLRCFWARHIVSKVYFDHVHHFDNTYRPIYTVFKGDFLPRGLWHFRKKCKFKFEPSTNEPFFHILLSSPLEGKKNLVYFNQEQYCKHLIGNGWSIPVVEHLLSRLPVCIAQSCYALVSVSQL